MSATITVRITGINEIKAAFKAVPFKMAQELTTAVQRVILQIEGDAKKEAPVNKQSGGGNLRQSIRSNMTGLAKGVVIVGANYGIYVHEGTAPHTIQIVQKKVLANVRSGQIFGKVVHHPGTKANPFLQRAVDKNETFINQQFETAIKNALS